jgi:hypothetical protein
MKRTETEQNSAKNGHAVNGRTHADETEAAHYSPRKCSDRAKCAWGEPERNGTKRDWYLTLFH